ncbi:1,4-dihydroxy-2-naphthoyl-CoA synthase [Ornithinimicrobium humiphilum]|uniref:1,4-dihydroxy-2-naphthoyl-CoA synthase n=1 Tax=Ornithinimicrobium humiphilum TaxID=125288 RepID=A0A543KRV5_9MICO|nr:enoyl-CoA hydratase/isomerase family protein [Ornithinimicrobium humiphilum]TQM97780.1 1,4-dihydroxy-2-naphthoyl-CoA synthase [Ornithinimicrobium humiphilum]
MTDTDHRDAKQQDDVLVAERAGATWITLNRPDRKNAYDPQMCASIVAAIKQAAASDVTAIVITGTQDSFCAGGFLANLAEPDVHELRSMFFGSLELFEQIRTAPQPVIAAVNGVAAGGGNELVVACDLAVAVESAWFGQTGVKIGSAPVLGGTNMLAMTIGEKRAKEVAFLCGRYPAREALEMGWINRVVPDGELEAAVDGIVAQLAQMSPRYLEIAKISSNLWWNSARDNYVSGLGMLVQAIGSKDMREGATAFLEKRRPSFTTRGDL